MVNRNIDLPSKRSALINEIEAPLRRKFRKERNYTWLWLLVIAILATILLMQISGIVDEQAKQALEFKKAQAAEVQPLCRQYLTDSKLNGTAAMETLKSVCK